jgi:ABC-type nitrate/sulfonate/bicarbonate transport system substrate-binding protein
MQVSQRWAKANMKEAKEINAAIDEAVAWFYDDQHRSEAIDIMVEAAKSDRKEIEDSYDFLRKIEFFARTSTIHRKPLENMMRDMVAIKDMEKMIPISSLVVPGLNDIAD